jgi:predicted dehydrogenase
VKIGIIGAGWIGGNAARMFSDAGVDLGGLADAAPMEAPVAPALCMARNTTKLQARAFVDRYQSRRHS